jgi:tetratricopeptide (TPR) repeat protein
MRCYPVLAAILLSLSFPLAAQPKLGEVAFANSGAAAAQSAFLRGLALLHDFEYSPAAEAFRQAQAADPNFALAYWGEAMTYNHAVWMEQDAAAARAVLARLGPTPEARASKAPSAREKAYLHAVETLYGDGSKEERDVRYSAEMAALHARFPDDVDATAFYALSLLGTAHNGRDYAIYMRAAALLEEVFPTHRQHPGVLHYLIHSYDDPVHAPLGLRAARLYGAIAPNAGHALHMTSHIFIAMGMWDEVIRANVEAMRTVNEQRAAAGKPPMYCHHYSEWLLYAYLQEGKTAEAAATLGACRKEAEQEAARVTATPVEPRRSAILSFADMQARGRIDAPQLVADDPTFGPAEAFVRTHFLLRYAQLIAAWPHDPAATRAAAADLRAQMPALRGVLANAPDYAAGQQGGYDVMLAQAEALDLLAAGQNAPGLAALRKAAADEQALPIDFGPPQIPKPSFELLGEELMRQGRYRDAVQAYQAALARAPGRTRLLQTLLMAARAAGDSSAGAAAHAELSRYTRPAARN